MFHIMVHVRRNAAAASRAVNEELDQFKQCCIAVLLVSFDPLINNSLTTQMKLTSLCTH